MIRLNDFCFIPGISMSNSGISLPIFKSDGFTVPAAVGNVIPAVAGTTMPKTKYIFTACCEIG